MAFNSLDNIKHTEAQHPSPTSKEDDLKDIPESLENGPLDRRASLLERTRHSISLAPAPAAAPQSRKSSHNRSRTSIYPINQFETPKKPGMRRSTINGIEEEESSLDKRIATPMEKLLSPDAEYDSVFKSRPKIALSPVLTPCRDGDGLDAGTSSPLGELFEYAKFVCCSGTSWLTIRAVMESIRSTALSHLCSRSQPWGSVPLGPALSQPWYHAC